MNYNEILENSYLNAHKNEFYCMPNYSTPVEWKKLKLYQLITRLFCYRIQKAACVLVEEKKIYSKKAFFGTPCIYFCPGPGPGPGLGTSLNVMWNCRERMPRHMYLVQSLTLQSIFKRSVVQNFPGSRWGGRLSVPPQTPHAAGIGRNAPSPAS